MYPSEQQYYNAMLRKGYGSRVRPEEVPFILQIHNLVNERGWEEVKNWERELNGGDGKGGGGSVNITTQLTRFVGRPKDMSPKAFIKTYLMGYTAPFDRHDWFVRSVKDDGKGQTDRRYVIDFYSGGGSGENAKNNAFNGNGKPKGAVDVYLDVRPAVDDFDSAVGRAKKWIGEFFK